jgi:hypothetical protein
MNFKLTLNAIARSRTGVKSRVFPKAKDFNLKCASRRSKTRLAIGAHVRGRETRWAATATPPAHPDGFW